MRDKDQFEDWIKQKAQGVSKTPPRSVWNEVQEGLQEPPASTRMKLPLFAIGFILCSILAIWFFSKYQNLSPAANQIAQLDSENIVKGENLFNTLCATCHNKDMVSKLTGPALGGVTNKHSKEWLYEFTRNSQKMIATGDPAANELWDEWKPTIMNSFPYLTDEELHDIFSYIDNVNYNKQPKKKSNPNHQVVNENNDTVSGDSLFEIKIEGPVDSLMKNGDFFHEEMDLKEDGNF